jgi:hypothetical protein
MSAVLYSEYSVFDVGVYFATAKGRAGNLVAGFELCLGDGVFGDE